MKGKPTAISSLCRYQGHCVLTKSVMPEIKPDEVLVEVSTAAICLTDIYAATGAIPCSDGVVLGHEFVGQVVELGMRVRGNEISLGDKVAVMPYVPCGACIDCDNDLSWQCSRAQMLGIDIDGAFSQFVAVPASHVYSIDNQLSDKLNTFAEPVAAAMSVLQAPIEPEQMIWVYGEGRIASLCAFVLLQNGYKHLVQGLTAPEAPVDTLVLVQQPTEAFDKDIAAGWLKNLKAAGLIVLKTRTPDPLFVPVNELIKKRLRIHAVNYGSIEHALAFIAKHEAFFAGLAGPVFSLEQHQQAFAEAKENTLQKVFLQIKAD